MTLHAPKGWYGDAGMYGIARKKYPWRRRWMNALNRCRSKNTSYSEKGIQLLISPSEVRMIWLRDKAVKMDRPVLDRIDPTWHYHFLNCRFITTGLNTSRLRYIPKHWRPMKDQPVRISAKFIIPIRKLAAKEGRSVKMQTERLLETAFALLADRELGLNSTPWKKKVAKVI